MSSYLSIPNLLSCLRILLSPVFVLCLFREKQIAALVVFTIAALSDFYDGYFARKLGQVSAIGIFLDPLADKILVLVAFTTFYSLGIISLWFLIVLFIRDFIITFMRLASISVGDAFITSRAGKWKTTLQFLSIYACIAFIFHLRSWGLLDGESLASLQMLRVFLYCGLALTVYSGLKYIVQNFELFARLISTFFFLGYFSIAPGSFASAAAAIFVYFVPLVGLGVYLLIAVSIFALGLWASSVYSKTLPENDASHIVIDECSGMLFALLLVPKSLGAYLLAFLLFRFFDVLKPFPISRLERLSGGLGIMLDDIGAGFASFVIMQLLQWQLFALF